MSTIPTETTNDPPRVGLSRGTRISGLLGLGKLLLLLAPFAAVRSCGSATPMTGVEVIRFAFFFPAGSPILILFLLVPLSGLIVLALVITSLNSPVDGLRRYATWMGAASIGSLVGLADAIVVAFMLDADHSPQFLWGFWGILGADLVTMALLWRALAVDQRQEIDAGKGASHD